MDGMYVVPMTTHHIPASKFMMDGIGPICHVKTNVYMENFD